MKFSDDLKIQFDGYSMLDRIRLLWILPSVAICLLSIHWSGIETFCLFERLWWAIEVCQAVGAQLWRSCQYVASIYKTASPVIKFVSDVITISFAMLIYLKNVRPTPREHIIAVQLHSLPKDLNVSLDIRMWKNIREEEMPDFGSGGKVKKILKKARNKPCVFSRGKNMRPHLGLLDVGPDTYMKIHGTDSDETDSILIWDNLYAYLNNVFGPTNMDGLIAEAAGMPVKRTTFFYCLTFEDPRWFGKTGDERRKMRLLLVSEDDLKRLIADAPEYCKETDYMCDERGQQSSSSMVLRRTVEWVLSWFSKWDQDLPQGNDKFIKYDWKKQRLFQLYQFAMHVNETGGFHGVTGEDDRFYSRLTIVQRQVFTKLNNRNHIISIQIHALPEHVEDIGKDDKKRMWKTVREEDVPDFGGGGQVRRLLAQARAKAKCALQEEYPQLSLLDIGNARSKEVEVVLVWETLYGYINSVLGNANIEGVLAEIAGQPARQIQMFFCLTYDDPKETGEHPFGRKMRLLLASRSDLRKLLQNPPPFCQRKWTKREYCALNFQMQRAVQLLQLAQHIQATGGFETDGVGGSKTQYYASITAYVSGAWSV